MTTYDEMLPLAKEELRQTMFESARKKKTIIEKLAWKLDSEGVPKNKISAKLSEDLANYVSPREVRWALGDEYKDKRKARSGKIAAKLEAQQKEPIAIDTSGRPVAQPQSETEGSDDSLESQARHETEQAKDESIFSPDFDEKSRANMLRTLSEEIDRQREEIKALKEQLEEQRITAEQSQKKIGDKQSDEYIRLQRLYNTVCDEKAGLEAALQQAAPISKASQIQQTVQQSVKGLLELNLNTHFNDIYKLRNNKIIYLAHDGRQIVGVQL